MIRLLKAFWFGSGLLFGLSVHPLLIGYLAMASTAIPIQHAPELATKFYAVALVLAVFGSALLTATAWWRSIYRERPAALLTTILTGVAAYLVAEAVGNGYFGAAWLALLLIAVVLFAGIDSARALWRELRPSAVKSEGRAF